MSSSEDLRAPRFLAVFAAAAGAFVLLVLAACWALDPSGLLRAAGLSPGLCHAGAGAEEERHVKPILPRMLRPEEILVGSSRVAQGFSRRSFPGRRTMNMGISGASLADIEAVARHAAAEPGLRRIWLGLDFGAFIEREPQRAGLIFPQRGWSAGNSAMRFGLFDQRALRATLLTAISFGPCAESSASVRGFTREGLVPSRLSASRDRALLDRIIRSWRLPTAERERIYGHRMARLDRLLADLRRQGVEVIVYLSPTSTTYREAIARAGLEQRYRRWRRDSSLFAARNAAILVESDTPAFLASIPAPACGSPSAGDCLFTDPVHFRPEVGDRIVRAARVSMGPDRRPIP